MLVKTVITQFRITSERKQMHTHTHVNANSKNMNKSTAAISMRGICIANVIFLAFVNQFILPIA